MLIRHCFIFLSGFVLLFFNQNTLKSQPVFPEIEIGKRLFHDDFNEGLENWVVEQTGHGKVLHSVVSGANKCLEIDGGGTTIWFRDLVQGPIMIEYNAVLINEGGENDNCRDLNCFWMARHPRAPYDLFEGWRSNSKSRSGVFSNYNDLRTYYAGVGGHKNTTTRFRRYTGHGEKPLLTEHDLGPDIFALQPNTKYRIRIISCNQIVRFYINDDLIFDFFDPMPYTSGWFGFRTVSNHVKIDDFSIYEVSSRTANDLSREESYAKKLGYNKGLTQKVFRKGWKEEQFFQTDENRWQSERTIFTDPETGGEIWQMSSDPAVESNEYTDIPVWSADGKYMLFRTLRNGNAERWLMNADGSNLRPVAGEHQTDFEKGFWSIRYPNLLYYTKLLTTERGIYTRLLSYNVETGDEIIICDYPGNLGVLQPPHPSEDLFLFGDHMKGEWTDKEHPSRAFIVNRKKILHTIEFEKLYHRLRFTKAAEGDVFFNFDQPRQSFTCKIDGSGRIEIPFDGGHPDWVPGGKTLFFNVREVLPDGTKNFDLRYDAVNADGSGLRTLYPYGGHASACLDGKYFVCDGGEGSGTINYVSLEKDNVAQTLFANHTSRYDHTNKWHPDHHSTHPHPNSSPDGTKIISNSDVSGQFSDLFVSISHFPDPPQELQIISKRGKSYLQWNRPRRCNETEGYFVYASENGPDNFYLYDSQLIQDTIIPIPDSKELAFQVVAREYSGLISRPSQAVWSSSGSNYEKSHFYLSEAESAELVTPAREVINMAAASNGYYVQGGDGGKVVFKILLNDDSDYMVWARISGKTGWIVGVNSTPQDTLNGIDNVWSWHKIIGPRGLEKGMNMLTFLSGDPDQKIDKIILSRDPGFYPAGKCLPDESSPKPPLIISGKKLSPNTNSINWTPSNDPDFSYYNVYASREPDFLLNQSNLLGSLVESAFTDWGLFPTESYFYSVTTVDLWGNESAPSNVYPVNGNAFLPVVINLQPEVAELDGINCSYNSRLGTFFLENSNCGEGCSAKWTFDIPEEGFFAIWGQSIAEELQIPEFELVIDDTLQVMWKAFGLYDTWKWSPVGRKQTGTPELFYLTSGRHSIEIMSSSDKDKVGGITITNDPSFYPVQEMRSTGY